MQRHLFVGLLLSVLAGCSRTAPPADEAIHVDPAARARLQLRFANQSLANLVGRPQSAPATSVDELALRRAVHANPATAPATRTTSVTRTLDKGASPRGGVR